MPAFRIVADDLGLAEPVNDGILFLLKEKKISGVSLLPTGAAFHGAVSKLQKIQGGHVGVHLTLVEETAALPPEQISSLVGKDGRFHANHRIFFLRYLSGQINVREVEAEFREQILRCVSSGLKITFLNSHQHLHLLPGIMDIVVKLAVEFHISDIRLVHEPLSGRPGGIIRKLQGVFLNYLSGLAIPKLKKAGLRYNDAFVGFLHAGNITQEDLRVAEKSGGELNCHPGYENESLRARYLSWGTYHWQKELELLERYTHHEVLL